MSNGDNWRLLKKTTCLLVRNIIVCFSDKETEPDVTLNQFVDSNSYDWKTGPGYNKIEALIRDSIGQTVSYFMEVTTYILVDP